MLTSKKSDTINNKVLIQQFNNMSWVRNCFQQSSLIEVPLESTYDQSSTRCVVRETLGKKIECIINHKLTNDEKLTVPTDLYLFILLKYWLETSD